MTPASKIACIAAAGALGTLTRYCLWGLAQRATAGTFPVGTLAVNGLGCLAFGFVWSLAEERYRLSTDARTIALVGFLGAFTTFSSFAFETGQLLSDSKFGLAAANVLAQNALGLSALFLGLALGKLV